VANKPDVVEKFGLGYLTRREGQSAEQTSRSLGPQAPLAPAAADRALERAYLTVGSQIVKRLEAAPQQEIRLHKLVEELDLDLEALLPIVERLVQQGIVTVAEHDRFGNNLIRLS
jgi:hypothetical protein